MNATEYRARLTDAVRAYVDRQTSPSTPRLRVIAAALVDRMCPSCETMQTIALRYRLDAVTAEAAVCGDCASILAADAGLEVEHRAELRRAAHHVAVLRQRRGAA